MRRPRLRLRLPRLVRFALRLLLRWGLRLAALCLLWVLLYRFVNPPVTPYQVSEWVRLGEIRREWTSLEDMSPWMPRAAAAAEDAHFCSHWGFDLDAIRDAMADSSRLRGASTISQQVAKNAFLWQGRSWLRKGLEAGFTVLIELTWPKARIMEVYLNIAEMDEGVFGVEAAAQRYFDTSAAKLSLGQAARIAAILPDPKGRSASRASAFVQRRANSVARGAETLLAEKRSACFEVER
ncbi:monofunctional biosynthetic peptidoglycan transglycosylase [Paroceanicella profunda]|uniref:Biosynthetic peptidoglycan transglycosylase n=1 Tax=Paroceanicella profunda TaxID=2579971 RepID=A0A5B8FUP2_9RHOB|nr:monofunctional biosynthetic peptidoglycan transglycosylase [Paroceanicella profunda]QDL90790.1 monofunctional biosynthetic peptidoglycan transglycosylase [Paroceanicella profunda]